jgi:CubicO group peptidase (beta-lactamase class C family)
MKLYFNKVGYSLTVLIIAGLLLSSCNDSNSSKDPKTANRLNRIDSLMHDAIQNHAFPGAAVAVGHDSNLVKIQGYGHFGYNKKWNETVTPKTLFDMASLTKVIATTTAVMQLYEQGKIHLDDKVSQYLPKFAKNGKGDITIRQLLTHSSGLKPDVSLKGVHNGKELINRVLTEKMTYKPDSKSVYSDSNFITLMLIVQKITGQKFADYCSQHIFKPLGMTHSGFFPFNESDTTHTYIQKTNKTLIVNKNVDTSNVAPTADHSGNEFWGVVNDPRSRLVGGVAGHAGLYTSASDLSKLAFMYLHHGKADGKQFLKASTIQLFTKKYKGIPNSHRALGWEGDYKDCSCGHLFGPNSFGHTGFTGTMIWFDPDQDLFGILLTNQVFPKGHQTKIYKYRRQFENLVYSSLVDTAKTDQ